jgi:universal stress protein A
MQESEMATTEQAVAHMMPVFRHILVPTDFSWRSQLAIDYAVELARKMHAQLTLLHVRPQPSALDYAIGGVPEEDWDKMQEEAERCLRDAVEHAKRRVLEVDSKLCHGLDIQQEILSIAKQIPADLLVLSTHRYTGWKHLLFGSDAEKMVARSLCPILVVPAQFDGRLGALLSAKTMAFAPLHIQLLAFNVRQG